MNPSVTVAVAQARVEQLPPIKHHLSITANSQEALAMMITREQLQPPVAPQDNLVDRLQLEKKILLNKVRQEGFELGVRSSSKLSYKEFRHFERVISLAASLDDDVLEYLWSFLDQKDYPQEARVNDPDFAYLLAVDPQSRVVFAQGWLEGVLSIWQTIKAQVATIQ